MKERPSNSVCVHVVENITQPIFFNEKQKQEMVLISELKKKEGEIIIN